MQSDEILYECIHKFNSKDAIFISKIADKKLHILMRFCTVLFLYARLQKMDITSFLASDNFISTVIFIIFLVFVWNTVTINAYLLGRRMNIDGQPIHVFFYKDYFKVESKNHMGYSTQIIEYNCIGKKVVINRNLVIKTNNPIDYTVLNSSDFITGNMDGLIKFLNNK